MLTSLDESAPKSFRHGTHRLVAPAETVARARRFMPVMGITRIANVTGLDSIGIPVVVVCRPNARSLSVAQGKGMDLAAAQASGLMESIESYHAERITLPLKLASHEELRYTHRLVDVAQLPRITRGRFQPHHQILWIEGYDLIERELVWLPYETVHVNYTVTVQSYAAGFIASSSGLASGNHILEAISHALCEVVERDATTLWHLQDETARAQTRIDLATVVDADCRAVLEQYARAGIAVGVWEITSDVGIPAFICYIVDQAEHPLRPLYAATGAGCHPVRPIALLRALLEAAQSRLAMIAGTRDDWFREDYERLSSPDILQLNRARVAAQAQARGFADGPSWESDTFGEDVAWELERLRAAGLQRAVVVDLTRPEFHLPVVKLVVPGLEPLATAEGHAAGPRAMALLRRRA